MMNQRIVKFERIRIVAMFLIILSHFSTHGLWKNLYSFDLNHLYLQFIRLGGGIGNILFFCISGYFLCRTNEIENQYPKIFEKILFLLIKTTVYSVLMLFIIFLFFSQILNPSIVFRSFFPILFQLNWFVSVYIFLLLFYPFWNHLIFTLTKKQLKLLIILLFFSLSAVSLTGHNIIYDNLRWAFLWFLVGAYIKKYEVQWKCIKPIALSCLILLCGSIVVMLFIASRFVHLGAKFYSFYYEFQRLFIAIISLYLFKILLDVELNENKFILQLSKSTLGVYLLHDHPLTREILWKNIFYIDSMESSLYLIPYSVLISIVVFLIMAVSDRMLSTILDPIIHYLATNIVSKVSEYI